MPCGLLPGLNVAIIPSVVLMRLSDNLTAAHPGNSEKNEANILILRPYGAGEPAFQPIVRPRPTGMPCPDLPSFLQRLKILGISASIGEVILREKLSLYSQ